MIKVTLAVHHFPPRYNAGAEIYTFRLARWLIHHGYDVEVVCVESNTHSSSEGLVASRDIYDGVPVWRLFFDYRASPTWFRDSYDNPAIGNWFHQYLQDRQPDLVHMHSGYLISASIVNAAHLQSIPIVVTLHDFWFLCPRITLLKSTGELCNVPDDPADCSWCLATEKRRFRWMHRASKGFAGQMARPFMNSKKIAGLLKVTPNTDEIQQRRNALRNALDLVDIILAPSEFLRQMFIKQGIPEDKIIYSRIGLDTSHWITAGSIKHTSDKFLTLAYLGQLAPHKGVHVLLDAFQHLKMEKRQACLKIYGDESAFPNYVNGLKKQAAGNPFIEFAGKYDNNHVPEILHPVDVIIVPSVWYENSPLVIMEALVTGTPVVTSNLGGMSELVQHKENGLLFQVGDARDLASQLQLLLDDPALPAQLAQGIGPVRMIDDEMEQITSMYRVLRERPGGKGFG